MTDDKPKDDGWFHAPPIKPRNRGGNLRCADCGGDAGMFHPAHPWGRCWVKLDAAGLEQCPCESNRTR
jgi:hypothetical protein